ncbi:MAG: hypothetical protein NTZ46_09745 [Verrucomicrobia bacterium]|nr:hypothetical protein [Verrucomicrobiota bacterium]
MMHALHSLLASWKSQNKRTTFLVCLLLFTAFSLLTLKPLWIGHGWPKNHEINAFALRTRLYAEHYRLHDFVPLWSSTDNNGLGSAMPALYHKLFYLLSGPLFLLTGKMKIALVLPILFFLLVGAFGMYRLLQVVGASRFTCIAGGLCLIAAKYTVTNWLIRGAVAEFSAAMLIPWALYYYLLALNENRVRLGLAVSLALIFLAHSVMGYYLGLLFGLFFLLSLLFGKNRLTGALLGSTLKAAVAFALLVGPAVWLVLTLGQEYEMKRILAVPNHPCAQFPPLIRYFWDEEFVFGSDWKIYSVQLDLPPLLFGVAGFTSLLLLGNWVNKWGIVSPLLPLAGLGLAAFFLQTHLSAPFYNHLPGAAYLQFPWRLLGLLTPVVIAIGLSFAEKSALLWGRSCGVALCTFSMVLLCGGISPVLYGNLPLNACIDRPLEGVCFSQFDEYVPATVPLPPATAESIVQEAKAKGCSILYNKPSEEVLRMVFQTESASAVSIPLPLYVSPLHGIKVYNSEGALVKQTTPGSQSGICRVEVAQGKGRVEIEMPDLPKLLKSLAAKQRH